MRFGVEKYHEHYDDLQRNLIHNLVGSDVRSNPINTGRIVRMQSEVDEVVEQQGNDEPHE